jgi:P27 family predicted phage terminase small subunit
MKRNGPPRKPTGLKIVEGTFRKDRAAPNEPKPRVTIPRPPPHLSSEARSEWRRVSHELYLLGLLSRIDRAALAAYCECWSDWVDASKMCATVDGKDRKVMKTQAGNLVENPYFSIKKRSMELMHKFLTEFGMTPASRSQINVLVDQPIVPPSAASEKNYA